MRSRAAERTAATLLDIPGRHIIMVVIRLQKRCVAIAILAIQLISTQSMAASFIENFDDGVLDPDLSSQLSPGFTMNLTGGEAVMQKSSGTMNGGVKIRTNFEVVGDFVATVDANRVDLSSFADMGLLSRHPAGTAQRLDIFFNDQTKIIGNFFVGPSQTSTIVNTGVSPVTFRIQRVGQTITIGYVFNGGFVLVASESGVHLAGPAALELFLEQNNGFSDSHLGKFDNFEITADAFDFGALPVPGLSSPALEAVVCILMFTSFWFLKRRVGLRPRQ